MEHRSFLDQLGNPVTVNFPPRRIISLVPSQTELLADLDLDEQVVGITKFCRHPKAWLGPKKIVGGTKTFNFEVIAALEPDLIIANKEENYEEGINRLKSRYPVWISDIVSFQDALAMITSVGELTSRKSHAASLISSIQESFDRIEAFAQKSVLYLIWQKPWMAAGRGTFINTMLERIGLVNAVPEDRYPELTAEYIQAINPEIVMLSSEPYPFQDKHIEEMKQLLPNATVLLVDGEMFSWYGSRLIKAPIYFNSLPLR